MVTTPANNMSAWPEIVCQRADPHGGPTHAHFDREVTVHLGGPTPYGDLTSIPERFTRSFRMRIWDPERHPVDGGPYCPCHDTVSETIASLGVWAPDETTMTLNVLDGHAGERFVDLGAQLGWFTLLASSCGVRTTAWEADADNLDLLGASVAENEWGGLVDHGLVRVGADTEPLPPEAARLVKIDTEGAEGDCVRVLWPSIKAGLVDHMLIEVTPFFADYYPDMVAAIVDAGFEAYVLPDKQRPPVDLADPATALAPFRVDTFGCDGLRRFIAGSAQIMCWFKRAGAGW